MVLRINRLILFIQTTAFFKDNEMVCFQTIIRQENYWNKLRIEWSYKIVSSVLKRDFTVMAMRAVESDFKFRTYLYIDFLEL